MASGFPVALRDGVTPERSGYRPMKAGNTLSIPFRYHRGMLTRLQRTVETVTDPRILRVHDYWLNARSGKAMPSRADIDPLDLGFCLGWICLVDVTHGAARPRFRFRLDGSRLTHLTGTDLTGRYADELPDQEYRDFVVAIYDRVVATAAPVFIANDAHWSDRGYRVEQITLPLSNDGKVVTGLLDVTLPILIPLVRNAGA